MENLVDVPTQSPHRVANADRSSYDSRFVGVEAYVKECRGRRKHIHLNFQNLVY